MRFYPFVFTSTEEGGMAAFYNYSAGADLCASREQSQACLSYAETKQSVRSNRVAASLGGGVLKAVGSNPGMKERADWLFWESHDWVNGRTLQETGQALPAWEYYGFIKDIPGRMNASVEFKLDDFHKNLEMLAEEQHDEKDVYFYHSDHLGSASAPAVLTVWRALRGPAPSRVSGALPIHRQRAG